MGCLKRRVPPSKRCAERGRLLRADAGASGVAKGRAVAAARSAARAGAGTAQEARWRVVVLPLRGCGALRPEVGSMGDDEMLIFTDAPNYNLARPLDFFARLLDGRLHFGALAQGGLGLVGRPVLLQQVAEGLVGQLLGEAPRAHR